MRARSGRYISSESLSTASSDVIPDHDPSSFPHGASHQMTLIFSLVRAANIRDWKWLVKTVSIYQNWIAHHNWMGHQCTSSFPCSKTIHMAFNEYAHNDSDFVCEVIDNLRCDVAWEVLISLPVDVSSFSMLEKRGEASYWSGLYVFRPVVALKEK